MFLYCLVAALFSVIRSKSVLRRSGKPASSWSAIAKWLFEWTSWPRTWALRLTRVRG